MGVNIWINRKHLYLDIYVRGKRKREKLVGLVLIGDKATDRETMRLAEIAKAKRAQQVFSGEWGLTDPVAGKQNLCQYLEKLAKEASGKRKEAMVSAMKHLKAYHTGTLPMTQITDRGLRVSRSTFSRPSLLHPLRPTAGLSGRRCVGRLRTRYSLMTRQQGLRG
ncbi:hypothetical protein Holit_02858 [Hollandina sp. SP2]